MSITCLLSHTYNDLRCPVCGEGFLILARAENLVSRMQVRRIVGEALRRQHTHMGATGVHSTEPFTVAADNCSPLEWLRLKSKAPAESKTNPGLPA
ncbi:hypothetical protein [Terriglobus aquaticus]|uniref:Uncharacterized protein n=1 Tax=Terriglobus aquaticus TaxID=940139 RepID=A0ABW9KNT2_9BACT|nr:hypothetical protein [Terriglobus aquaticus]